MEMKQKNFVLFISLPNAVLVEDGIESLIAPYDRQFASKTVGQRAMAIFAGPMMNFILAFVIFLVIGLLQGIPSDDPRLGKLTDDGAAIEAGLKEGDLVHSIDDIEISSWLDVVEVIRENPDNELTFNVERNGETLEILVTPQVNKLEDGQTIGLIGVYSPTEKSPLKAVQYGATETYFWTKAIFAAVGKLVTGQFTIDALSGPVGIYQSTDMVAQNGIFYLMRWAGMLSINLGIMNLLPIPALDGGRLLFFAVEAIRGKPIDRQKEGMIHFLGFALLMLLMLVVTWNDIQRFFL